MHNFHRMNMKFVCLLLVLAVAILPTEEMSPEVDLADVPRVLCGRRLSSYLSKACDLSYRYEYDEDDIAGRQKRSAGGSTGITEDCCIFGQCSLEVLLSYCQ